MTTHTKAVTAELACSNPGVAAILCYLGVGACSMPCSWLTANLKPVDQYHQGNHHKAQPGKYPEAIHEREEVALA